MSLRFYVDAVNNAEWYVVDRVLERREGPFSPSQATALVRDRNAGRGPRDRAPDVPVASESEEEEKEVEGGGFQLV